MIVQTHTQQSNQKDRRNATMRLGDVVFVVLFCFGLWLLIRWIDGWAPYWVSIALLILVVVVTGALGWGGRVRIGK